MAKPEQIISVYPSLEKRFDLSYAIKAGNQLFLSGLVSADDDFKLVGAGDMEAQIRHIYQRLQFVLAKAGANLRHVVAETNYTTNSPELTRCAWVRAEIYKTAGAAMPVATGVHVPSLTLPGAMLEVHATAVLD
ncbi:MAG: RidA family protein [Alphaproteobacteria bacterium]|nr:RidA family protein [Alphaproteobacteria bacterium]